MRIFFIAIVFALSGFFLAGCSSPQESQNQAQTEVESESNQEISSEKQEEQDKQEQQGEQQGGEKEEWLEQLQKGEKLSCTYTDDQGGEAQVFMDGENYRMEYVSDQGNMTSVSREGVLYIWGDQMPDSGMKFAQDCFEDFDTPSSSSQEYYTSSEEVVEEIPDISCTSIDRVDTSIPENISFVDQCDMMKQFQQMETQLPEGVEMIP